LLYLASASQQNGFDGRMFCPREDIMGLDDIVDKAKDVAGDVADKAKDVAGDVADKAKDVAGDVANKAKDVAGEVKDRADHLIHGDDDEPAATPPASGGTGA
jgi:hypothetical protein